LCRRQRNRRNQNDECLHNRLIPNGIKTSHKLARYDYEYEQEHEQGSIGIRELLPG
jgi:hypothetical protein